MNQQKKVIVIGGNGFLGREVVKQCLERGWKTDCAYFGKRDSINKESRAFKIEELEKIRPSYDIVFMLAAKIPYGKMDEPDLEMVEANIGLPIRVITHFKKSKIVFASSVSIYGDTRHTLNELSACSNPSLYGLSKLAGEYVIKNHSLYSIVRFASLYGKGMKAETFLPKIVANAKSNGKITLFGDGRRKQNYFHVRDAAELFILAGLTKSSDTYLGISNKSYSNLEVAKKIKKLLPKTKIEFTGEDNSASFVYNHSASYQKLGFLPKISLELGLKELIDE